VKKTSNHKVFVDSLPQTERMLIQLRDELYDGDWKKMQIDLEDRLAGKPYIFKLVNRIEQDLDGIKKLKGYEEKNKVNLKEFI
jgi:hypothetical protein